MKTTKDFANWFIERDKHIMEIRLKKEKNVLKKELRNLEDERNKTRGHLHRVEALIEKQEEVNTALPKTSEGGA